MKRKMVIIGISYILGLFFASFFIEYALWIIAVISAAAFAVFILFKALTLKAALTAAISFFVGVFIYSGYTSIYYTPVIELKDTSIVFTGMVKSSDEYAGEKVSYILEGEFDNGVKASVLCYTDNYDCRYGDYIRVKGTFSVPDKTFLYDNTEYYKGLSVFLEANIDCEYTVLYTNDHQIVRKVQSYRKKLQRRIYAVCGKTGGSLTAAMLFGSRDDINMSIESAFYHAGIGPMLAISGFHLILFNGLCNVFGNRTRLHRIMQLLMTLFMTMLFALVAMWPVSVLRAGIMLIIARSACLFCRSSDSLSSLFISVIIITCTKPYLIHNVGFLLSVAGTFGVNSFAPWINEKLPLNGWFGGIFKMSVSSGIVSLCTLPICLHFFPKTSLLAPVSNVIFSPMCIIIILMGIVIFFLGGDSIISIMCGQVIDAMSKLLTDGLLWMQNNITYSFPSGWQSLSEAAFILSSMTVAIFILTRKRRMVKVSVVLSAVIMFAGQFMLARQFESKLRVFALGGSNGQVIVVTYAGRTDVIDIVYNGKNPDYVRSFIEKYGIRLIDCLYLTDDAYAAAAAYADKLCAVNADMVLLSSESELREKSVICGQIPQPSDQIQITANEYEISEISGRLTISAYKKVLIAAQNNEILFDYDKCDYLISINKNSQGVYEISGKEYGKLLCSGNNIEIILNDNGKFDARRLY